MFCYSFTVFSKKTRIHHGFSADADSVNARYLIQGGFIEREAAGIYNYLPLGWRVLKNQSNYP